MPNQGVLFGKRPAFWVLFLGLAATFAAAISLVVVAAPSNPVELTSTTLTNLANVMAAGVDGTTHIRLARSRVIQTDDYDRVAAVLKSGVGGQALLDRAYTVMRSGDGSVMRVVMVAGDDDRRHLMVPVERVPIALQRCLDYGVTTPSGVPIHRPDGDWLEAYAPIHDPDGQVVGAVVTAQRTSHESGFSNPGFRWLAIPILIALVISLGVAWTVDANLSLRTTPLHPACTLRPVRTFLEIAVTFAVVAVIGQTVWRNASLSEQRERRARSVSALRALTDSMAVLTEFQHGGHPDREKLFSVASRLSDTGSDSAAQQLRMLAGLPTGDRDLVMAAKEFTSEIALKQQEITEILAVGTLDEQARAQDVYQTLIVTVAVALAALLLMRLVGQQQKSLEEVTLDRNEAKARYARVVEGLPVGLFVIEHGLLAFTNAAWKTQFGAEEGVDKLATFETAVHPEDLPIVRAELTQAERQGKPFHVEYRVLNSGKVTYMESRGTPVFDKDGTCRQLMGFTLDVTQTVEAKLAIQRTFAEVENKNRLLGAALGELEMNLENVVRSLVRAVEAKDPYTAGHSERVKTYSMWLGERVGLSKFELRILELGTLVHDVGKIGTPDAILTKPGRLTTEEYEVIKLHPEFGVKIIESIGLFRDCLPIVRWHHEKLNGTGYPDGLKGNDIPYLVRIATIADIFDAMTSTRAYRHGMAVEEVLGMMGGMTDRGELDLELFSAFIEVIMERGVVDQVNREAA
jgi:HD-GYP domain-containing protein (c-di-GMP phosphodiesterase class II)